MTRLKLALAQMPVIGGQRDENLRCAVQHIADAAQAGAEIVLLPEALDCGWCHSSALNDAGSIPHGDACLRLREAARTQRIYVCAGLIERSGELLFNSAVLISPEGEVLLHHRKINELTMAHHLYACGDRLAVAHTPLGTLGLMICADGFARTHGCADHPFTLRLGRAAGSRQYARALWPALARQLRCRREGVRTLDSRSQQRGSRHGG